MSAKLRYLSKFAEAEALEILKVKFDDTFTRFLAIPLHCEREYFPHLLGSLESIGSKTNERIIVALTVNHRVDIGLDIDNPGGHDHTNENIDVFYDGKTLPFDNNHFDSIFLSEVCEHLFDVDATFTEINRVLKPGGKVMITMPFMYPEHEIPYDFGRYTEFGFKEVLDRNKFKIIKHQKLGTSIEAISQLLNTYCHRLMDRSRSFKILKPLVVPSVNLVGIFFSKLVPSDDSIYIGHFYLVEKT